MPDGAMLMGGEMTKEDNVWKMKHGFDEMYTSPQFDSTGKNAKVWDYPKDEWHKVIDINLNAVFYCCKAIVPHMRKNNYGRFISYTLYRR